MKLNKNDEQVVSALKPMGVQLTMQEIVEKTGIPAKKVFKSLRKLFENEMIESNARKYKLLAEKPPANKAKTPETTEKSD
jgi:sugar-specific transcriptional regulator TrmB